MTDMQDSKATLSFAAAMSKHDSFRHTMKNILSPSEHIGTGDYSEIEVEILGFCEREVEKAKRLLNRTYQEGKEIKNID